MIELDATALARAYASGALTPIAALESVLERLDAVNPSINAFVARDDKASRESALASTGRWSQGRPLSRLDGVPVSVKDNIVVQGFPCRWGSPVTSTAVLDHDETPVARLREAGLVLFGKTNLPELALQGYTDNRLFGATRNPWDPGSTPGGSSGGAVAAVAAGIGPVALATDGGGSIRRPAGFTGLVGLKPGRDVVPRGNGLPATLPDMEVVGPLARCVEDIAGLLDILAPGLSLTPALSANPPGRLRIVHWRAIGESPVDPVISQRIDEVAERLRTLGHEVVATPAPPSVARFNALAWPVFCATGVAAVLRQGALDPHGLETLSPPIADMLRKGQALSATALFDACEIRRDLVQAMRQLFAGADLILTPGSAAMPWPALRSHPDSIGGVPVDGRGHAVFTGFANGAGLPAIALPARPSASGMPVGFQLVGPWASEARLLSLASHYESRFPWSHLWPDLGIPLDQQKHPT